MASTNNDILCDTNSEDDVPLASINSDYIYQSEDNEDEHQSEDNQDEHAIKQLHLETWVEKVTAINDTGERDKMLNETPSTALYAG